MFIVLYHIGVLYLFCFFFNFMILFMLGNINLSSPLFWEGKNIQNVDYYIKVSRLLNKLLYFLAKVRAGALATRLLI